MYISNSWKKENDSKSSDIMPFESNTTDEKIEADDNDYVAETPVVSETEFSKNNGSEVTVTTNDK